MTNNPDFDQILSICLDRLRAGDSVADCLADYPPHASRLAPLLDVASLLQTPTGPTLSEARLRAGEARLLARAAALRARQRKGRGGVATLLLRGTRRLVAASVVGVLLFCGVLSAGTVSAASASLPGSPLYPVKQATENIVSWVAFTPQLQTRVHLAWAERRLREAEALIGRDGAADESVLAAMEHETEQALTAAEQAGPDQLTAVAAHTEHQQVVLKRVLDKAPLAARPGLERALAASAKGHARAQSALDRVAPGKPAKDHPHGAPPGQAGQDRSDTETATPTPEAETAPDVDTTSEVDVIETLTTTPGAADELRPSDDDQRQGAGSTPDEGSGQGQGAPGKGLGQGEGQGKGHAQGHGQGKDKERGRDEQR